MDDVNFFSFTALSFFAPSIHILSLSRVFNIHLSFFLPIFVVVGVTKLIIVHDGNEVELF